MRHLYIFLAMFLHTGITYADEVLAKASEQAQINSFESCKKHAIDATKSYSSEILENTSTNFKLKIMIDDASFEVSCTRTILGTRH